MKVTTIPRTPYRSGTVVRLGAIERVSEASLGRAIMLTQLVLLTLCTARVGADWLRGHATIEGGLALVLVGAFATWLVSEAIVGATRSDVPTRTGATLYRFPSRRISGVNDARSS
jgi:hypothetical protein